MDITFSSTERQAEEGILSGSPTQREIEISNRRRKNWMMALGDANLSSDDYSYLVDEAELRMKEVSAAFDDSTHKQAIQIYV